eukprot:1541347-Pleurochrysis_carterae.AAC.5
MVLTFRRLPQFVTHEHGIMQIPSNWSKQNCSKRAAFELPENTTSHYAGVCGCWLSGGTIKYPMRKAKDSRAQIRPKNTYSSASTLECNEACYQYALGDHVPFSRATPGGRSAPLTQLKPPIV